MTPTCLGRSNGKWDEQNGKILRALSTTLQFKFAVTETSSNYIIWASVKKNSSLNAREVSKQKLDKKPSKIKSIIVSSE